MKPVFKYDNRGKGMVSLKKKFSANLVAVGSWITLAHPAIAEIMSGAGFDWLAVDLEHSAITLAGAEQLIRTIELCGVTPLIRVGENNPNLIKRAMDTGAHGAIVPMVNDKEDAQAAVDAVKYPPLGKRGVGLARAQGYGLEFQSYKEWVNKESIVIVQVEHKIAVENLKEILEVEGVDAFIVGPYDLSASFGRPGEVEHPQVIAALKQAVKISRKMNKPAGFHVVHPDERALLKKIKEGYRFLALGLDTLFLGGAARGMMKKIRMGLRQ